METIAELKERIKFLENLLEQKSREYVELQINESKIDPKDIEQDKYMLLMSNQHLKYIYYETKKALDESNKQVDILKEENAKLQEQLKNAFCPKYTLGQELWLINYEKVYRLEVKGIYCIVDKEGEHIFYQDGRYNGFCRREDQVFETKAEAQKHLEELK